MSPSEMCLTDLVSSLPSWTSLDRWRSKPLPICAAYSKYSWSVNPPIRTPSRQTRQLGAAPKLHPSKLNRQPLCRLAVAVRRQTNYQTSPDITIAAASNSTGLFMTEMNPNPLYNTTRRFVIIENTSIIINNMLIR